MEEKAVPEEEGENEDMFVGKNTTNEQHITSGVSCR
jgi:hypothetical protein